MQTSIRLSDFKYNVTSQNGEDGVIAKIFECIGVSNKWCVEFGADDGKQLSNTWNLINNHKWSGVQIEWESTRFMQLKNNYADNDSVICIRACISHEGENTLDNILSKTLIPKDFNLLVIDIDGNDYHVWKSLKKYTPRVVIIEINPTFPPHIEYVGPEGNIDIGTSALSMTKLANQKGYELVAHIGTNCIYVRKEDFRKIPINNNDLYTVFDDSQIAYLISTYSGVKFTIQQTREGQGLINWFLRRDILSFKPKNRFMKLLLSNKVIQSIGKKFLTLLLKREVERLPRSTSIKSILQNFTEDGSEIKVKKEAFYSERHSR